MMPTNLLRLSMPHPLGQHLVQHVKGSAMLLSDKADESDELRQAPKRRAIAPAIPNKSSRKQYFRSNNRPTSCGTVSRTASADSKISAASPHATTNSPGLPCLDLPRRRYRLVDFMSLDPTICALTICVRMTKVAETRRMPMSARPSQC
jgi:hypothetical protein